MNANEMREFDGDKLAGKLAEYRQELFDLRFQHSSAQLENTQRLGEVKRNIARIMTIQRERELGA